MYDWKRIIEDVVPCSFYDEEFNELPDLGYLIKVSENKFFPHYSKEGEEGFLFCEPICIEDKKEYKIKEKIKTWRPCQNWEEFRPFMGEIAKHKDFNIYKIIDVYNTINVYDNKHGKAGEYWFENYTLEDGSPIGIEEEV